MTELAVHLEAERVLTDAGFALPVGGSRLVQVGLGAYVEILAEDAAKGAF